MRIDVDWYYQRDKGLFLETIFHSIVAIVKRSKQN